MKLSLFIILLVAIAGVLAQDAQSPAPAPQAEENEGGGQDIVIVTNPSTTPAPPSSPTPSTPSPETSPTPSPTSPSPSPSPSTPTPSPSSPTPSPTPTPTNPNPTTSRPPILPTSTAAPVVPAPPAFPKNVGNWSVFDGESTCVLLTGALQVHLVEDNATDLVIDVPNTLENVNVSGRCNPERQTLALNWWSQVDQGERENTLRLEFSKEGDNQYALSSVSFKLREVTPDASRDRNSQITGQFFLTSINHSYECIANQRVEPQEASKLYLLTEKLQFEAFRGNDASGTTPEPYRFSEADQCKADHHISTGTMLWIAIGIGLAIVACIALAVYLIKRCRREGYQPLETQT